MCIGHIIGLIASTGQHLRGNGEMVEHAPERVGGIGVGGTVWGG